VKKILAALLSSAMCVTVLAGCGSSTTSSNSTSASSNSVGTDSLTTQSNDAVSAETESAGESVSSGENKTLSLFFWDDLDTSTDLNTQVFKEAIDEFNAEDNGYTIETTTTDISNYYIKLNALVAADDMPDVFVCHPGSLMRNAAKAGVLMPLDDLLKTDGWYDTFNTSYFDNLKYNDQIVAIPYKAAAACVFYNKDIFSEAGVEKLPTTWDEFLDACQKIKDAGYAPIASSGTESWVIGILGGYLADRNGGSLSKILSGKINWTDQSFIDAGDCLLQLVDNGYFQDSFLGDSNDQMTNKFITGQAAMMITGSWGISSIAGEGSTVEDIAGVFPFPAISTDSDPIRWIIKTDNICISHDTKNLDAALDFFRILSSEDIQKRFAEVAGSTPILASCDVDYNAAPPQLKELNDCLQNMTGSFGYFNESLPSETGGAFNNAILSIALKQETPQEAFQVVQDTYTDELASEAE